MRMFNKKSILSIMMVLVMALSVFSLSVFAEEGAVAPDELFDTPVASPAPGAEDVNYAEDLPLIVGEEDLKNLVQDSVLNPEEIKTTGSMEGVGQPEIGVPSESGDETEPATKTPNMIFEPMRFVHTLKFMGVGMIGIFIVMGVIIVSVVVLNKVTSPKKKSDDE